MIVVFFFDSVLIFNELKPLQFNIGIKTHLNEKILALPNLRLKTTTHTKSCINNATKSAEFETFPRDITPLNAWEFYWLQEVSYKRSFVTLWET